MSALVPQSIAALGSAGYGQYVSKIGQPIKPLGKRFVDASKVEDHHAIIPTENAPGSLTQEQRAIYDMVARRLLGAFFPDRIVAKTEIVTVVEKETFKTIGKVVRQEGWAEVDSASSRKRGSKKDDADEEESGDSGNLPAVKKGEPSRLVKGEVKKGKTTPPKPYTEGDLLGAMESAGKDVDDEELREAMKDSGLGTPATRSGIIEELVRRKFVERKRTSMIPTELGIMLIRRIKHPILMSPALTGEWEKALKDMERGKVSKDVFLDGIERFVTKIVDEVRKEANMANVSGTEGGGGGVAVELGKCPKCDGTLRVRPSKFGKNGHYAKCDGDGCKVSFDCSADGTPDGGLCKHCQQPVKLTANGSGICISCDQWQQERQGGGATVADPCPKCGKGLSLRKWEGAYYVKCNDEGCKTSYDTDEKGKPKFKCKFCKGPVRKLRNGSKKCVASGCEKWQEEKAK
jgi:DNA topoisomerase-3